MFNLRSIFKKLFFFFMFMWILFAMIFSVIYINIYGGERVRGVKTFNVKEFKPFDVKFFAYKEPIFIIHKKGEYLVLSALCTFRRGILNYNAEDKVFECPVHGEKYDLNGNPLNKKLPPLKKFSFTIKGGDLYVIME